MHTHSKYSGDGVSEVHEMFDRAEERGLDGLAITDHFDNRAWDEARELAEDREMFFIPGEELRILDKNKRVNGEVLVYFLNEGIGNKTIQEINKEVRGQEGLLFLAHPFSRTRYTPRNPLELLEYVDGIETLNARSRFRSTNKKAFEFAEEHGLPTVAGSDGHIPREIGCSYTEVKGASSLEEFKEGLKEGRGIARGKRSGLLLYYASQVRGRV